jgi:hypothetical protein
VWTTRSSPLRSYRGRPPGLALEIAGTGCTSTHPIRQPRFAFGRRSRLKRHCPKLTVFCSSANRLATFRRLT